MSRNSASHRHPLPPPLQKKGEGNEIKDYSDANILLVYEHLLISPQVVGVV